MKKTFSLLSLFIALSAIAVANNNNGKYTIDTQNSVVEWFAEKVTGKHNGTMNIQEGSLIVENGAITSGEVTIDMNSLTVLDIEDPKYNANLVNHLKSDDFFSVEKHETSTFKINEIVKLDGNKHNIKGDLTIKGITHELEFPATIVEDGNKIVAIGEAQVDRTKYDIKYRSGKFFEELGDKMIYDTFTIKVKIGAAK